MIANLAIGALIFGYAGWALFRFVKKSKQGKCASCSMNKSCQAACDPIENSMTVLGK
ncbi:FeoB-associated Cys-rich membrane protein [Aneurinibacillus tyrosinisolvens]|uniref:FeoB-associated Cys-rich membrane protein n=1 Tax=Aneurinibacillus tyrosinisolvens TaxID=1443435 RepID=UPI00063F20C9|nr:FeoB-associated Cys-rich membrane protein [Aneurinibacillus tyrosinisolvens]